MSDDTVRSDPVRSDTARAHTARPWYRRRSTLVAAALAAIVAVTVITDLPAQTSRASDISAEQAVMSELNPDLAPCAYAVHEALEIWGDQSAHTLSAADQAQSASLLRDDQNACSFTNEYIFDLSNIEVPGSPAGKDMGDLVATSILWSTSDALKAIEAVQTLMVHGHDASALAHLAAAEEALAKDRAAGLRELMRADRVLDTTLPRPDMPVLATPGTS
jgi:hypothetical protein